MAYTVTLAELRTACLEQSDEQGYGYIDTVQLDRMINRSWARLYGRLAQLSEDDFTEAHTFTTEAGRDQYLLPGLFLKVRSVELYPGGFPGGGDSLSSGDPFYDPVYGTASATDVRRLRLFDLRERPRLSGSRAEPTHYRTIGSDKIRIMPVPSSAMGVLVWYVPAPRQLAASPGPSQVSSIDARAGWDDWIVYDVVAKIALKQEQDAATPLALRDSVWREDIEALVGSTDEADPERVLDIEGEDRREEWGLTP